MTREEIQAHADRLFDRISRLDSLLGNPNSDPQTIALANQTAQQILYAMNQTVVVTPSNGTNF